MKRLLLTSLFLGLFFSSLAQSPRYLDNVLIIRLSESGESTLQKRAALQSNFNTFGIQIDQPVWDQRKANKVQERRNRKKSLSTEQRDRAIQIEKRLLRTHYARVQESGLDLEMLARKISSLPGVDYAEPLYLYQTSALPNDPFVGPPGNNIYDYQNFSQAWDVQKSSAEMVIAIVDSGVDYTHEDLQNKMWTNPDEIPNDGIDNDNNGFIDDDKGWDFWESGYTFGTIRADNDPKGEHSNHGTHVAGISAAETNNGVGLPGTGYNANYMAIKAGGVADDPNTTDVDESRSVAFGYDGVLYAVLMGADVINNSWGGGGFSVTGRDIIAYAEANDIVVLSAASNEGADQNSYPAAYEGSISVGSVNLNSGVRSNFSNYGFSVDVMATGSGIRSTVLNNQYGVLSGTSMSTPVAAGLAALIRSQYPDWSAKRVALQMRSSATRVDDANDENLRFKLGNGLIDAFKAVNTPLPGIVIEEIKLVNNDDEGIQPGQSGKLVFTVHNYGAQSSALQIDIEVENDGLTLSETSLNLGSVSSDATELIEINVDMSEDFNVREKPSFKIEMSDASLSYADFKMVEISDFLYEIVENNNIVTSFAADGTMGFSDPGEGASGIGFSVNMAEDGAANTNFIESVLYSSSLVISANNRAINQLANDGGGQARHFRADSLYRLKKLDGESLVGSGVFNTSGNILAPRFTIKMETFASSETGMENAIYVLYNITSTSSNPIRDVRVGFYVDWDLGDYSNNILTYSKSDSLIYVSERNSDTTPYISTLAINGISSLFAINNAQNSVANDSLRWGVYDGFSDQEKIWMLNNGVKQTSFNSPTDVSVVTASGPYTFEPNETKQIGFIHVFGRTAQELINNARSARASIPFQVSDPDVFLLNTEPTDIGNTIPLKTELVGNYPNPFNPTTNVRFNLANTGDVELSVYNMLGQKVMTLVNQKMAAGMYQQTLDASNWASGMYLVQLKTNSTVQTSKLTLVK